MHFVFVHRVRADGPTYREPQFEAEDSVAAMAQVTKWMVESKQGPELAPGEMMGVERLDDAE